MHLHSDYLFAEPSYLSGMARLLDFAGALNEYNSALSEEEADARALAMDWQMVAQDHWRAIEQFEREHPELSRTK
jgi:hypothetical protein